MRAVRSFYVLATGNGTFFYTDDSKCRITLDIMKAKKFQTEKSAYGFKVELKNTYSWSVMRATVPVE